MTWVIIRKIVSGKAFSVPRSMQVLVGNRIWFYFLTVYQG
jgi:hypothetical protein